MAMRSSPCEVLPGAGVEAFAGQLDERVLQAGLLTARSRSATIWLQAVDGGDGVERVVVAVDDDQFALWVTPETSGRLVSRWSSIASDGAELDPAARCAPARSARLRPP